MIKKSFKKVNPGNFTITKKSPGEYVIKRNNRTIEIETSLIKLGVQWCFIKSISLLSQEIEGQLQKQTYFNKYN